MRMIIMTMAMIMVTADTIIITVMGTATTMFTIITMITVLTRRACLIAVPIRRVKRSPA